VASPRTIARLEARILRRAAHCLQFEIADPRAVFLTITRVELAKDLSRAKIYYSVLGDEAERSRAEHMLSKAGGYIQRQVARVLETRTVPHMTWVYDDSVAEASRVDLLIRAARERDRELRIAAGLPPEDAAPDGAANGRSEDADVRAGEAGAEGSTAETDREPEAEGDAGA
jgi:ribosome-binding factor A